MTQHAGLTAERWAAFTLDPQILMIGNEMNRAAKLMGPSDREARQIPLLAATRGGGAREDQGKTPSSM